MLDRKWFGRDAPIVAADLLNKVVVHPLPDGSGVAGRIVEVEVYMQDDPASHTFRGRTIRNAVMFGPAGHLYVYLSYGIHHCMNIVTGPQGNGQAVLVRALDPVSGVDVMRVRRGGRPDREIANGPGKLTQALGIDLSHDGLDLLDASSRVVVVSDGTPPPDRPRIGPRVGITKAVNTPWRFRT